MGKENDKRFEVRPHCPFLCSFPKYVGNQFRSTMEFPWIDIVFYSFDVVSIALIALRTKAANNAGNAGVVKIHVQRACVPHRFRTATDKNIGSVFRRKHPSAHKCDWPTHVLCSCNRFATAFARWHLTWNTSVLYHVQVQRCHAGYLHWLRSLSAYQPCR